jgi:hypothetical protein
VLLHRACWRLLLLLGKYAMLLPSGRAEQSRGVVEDWAIMGDMALCAECNRVL